MKEAGLVLLTTGHVARLSHQNPLKWLQNLCTSLPCCVAGKKKERCQPVSHCWTADSKLYCSCKGGQVISVDTETNRVAIVLNPSAQESQRDRTETLTLLRKSTMESIVETEEEQSIVLFFCLFSFSLEGFLLLQD